MGAYTKDNYGQPFDIDEPIWSESVVLAEGDSAGESKGEDGVSFGVMLCRWPSVGWAWVWAHVSIGDRFFGYNVDHQRCTQDVTDVHADSAAYAASDVRCELTRTGARDELVAAVARAELDLHESREPPNAPGGIRVAIEARFTPGVMAGNAIPDGSRRAVRHTRASRCQIGRSRCTATGTGTNSIRRVLVSARPSPTSACGAMASRSW